MLTLEALQEYIGAGGKHKTEDIGICSAAVTQYQPFKQLRKSKCAGDYARGKGVRFELLDPPGASCSIDG